MCTVTRCGLLPTVVPSKVLTGCVADEESEEDEDNEEDESGADDDSQCLIVHACMQ